MKILLLSIVTAVLSLSLTGLSYAAQPLDPTDRQLTTCLNDPAKASTADQEDCEAAALKSYDQRMNIAYSRLQKTLPEDAATALRAAQRSWIAYRDLEARVRSSLFETRQGTMYAPMQADAETAITRDRTLLLERYVGILAIDGP